MLSSAVHYAVINDGKRKVNYKQSFLQQRSMYLCVFTVRISDLYYGITFKFFSEFAELRHYVFYGVIMATYAGVHLLEHQCDTF